MAAMTRTAPVSPLAPEFEDFLFAPVREDENGMLLSVISLLARLDFDPWQEAADLARLPKAKATHKLAALIAALPDWPLAHLDSDTIAARLIARLPYLASANVPSAEKLLDASVGVRTAMQSQPFRYILLVVMVCVLGGLGIAARQLSVVQADNSSASTSSPPAVHQ